MCKSLVQMESRISESKSHKGEISDMKEIWSKQIIFVCCSASQERNGSLGDKEWEIEIKGNGK